MSTTGIPHTLVLAFRNAVFAYDNAREGIGGVRDPLIPSSDPQYANRKIDEIATIASIYTDEMPEDVYMRLQYLVSIGPASLRRSFPNSYAIGGDILRDLYHDLQRDLRRRGLLKD